MKFYEFFLFHTVLTPTNLSTYSHIEVEDGPFENMPREKKKELQLIKN